MVGGLAWFATRPKPFGQLSASTSCLGTQPFGQPGCCEALIPVPTVGVGLERTWGMCAILLVLCCADQASLPKHWKRLPSGKLKLGARRSKLVASYIKPGDQPQSGLQHCFMNRSAAHALHCGEPRQTRRSFDSGLLRLGSARQQASYTVAQHGRRDKAVRKTTIRHGLLASRACAPNAGGQAHLAGTFPRA